MSLDIRPLAPHSETIERLGPRTIQIFHDIRDYVLKHHLLAADWESLYAARFAVEREKHDFMKETTYADYASYWATYVDPKTGRKGKPRKSYTACEMFKVIYSHRLRTEAEWIGLASFTWKSDFPETMDLGRLNGKTPLGLAPRDCHYEWEFSTYRDYCALFGDLVFPDVCTQAVTYPTPKHFVPSETAIDPADDQILRRFVDIGSLLIQPDARGYWQMTGHVVVIDLDRDRHPWLILAKEWCDNDEDDYPNTSTAPDTVIRDDRDALGILPDDKDNRTTIARFVPFSSPSNPKAAESSEQKPFLLRFGENFEFGLERPIDSDPSSQEGPSLPKVMSWFRRPDGEHVCVDGERKLYMLREWDTGKYVYPRR